MVCSEREPLLVPKTLQQREREEGSCFPRDAALTAIRRRRDTVGILRRQHLQATNDLSLTHLQSPSYIGILQLNATLIQLKIFLWLIGDVWRATCES